MKRILSLGLMLLSYVVNASTAILYPVEGEIFPGNGIHSIQWSNSAIADQYLYLDWYDTNGIWITSSAIYSNSISAGTNTFTLYSPSNYPGPDMFFYKVRVKDIVGGAETSSGYISITDSAQLEGVVQDTNSWSPGQMKSVSVAWCGFQSNDVMSISLESPDSRIEGYGFVLTNFAVTSSCGTQQVDVPYPDVTMSAYPPATNAPISGIHTFTLANPRCGIVTNFGAVDLLTVGLRVSLLSSGMTNIIRGSTNVVAKVKLDASLATNDVTVSSVKIVFTSYTSNWIALDCSLSNQTAQSSVVSLSFNPQTNQTYDTLVTFPIDVTIPQGQTKSYSIVCNVKPECGIGSFIWNTQNGVSNIFATVVAEYEGGGEIDITTAKSSGSFVVIEDVVEPRFISSSRQGNFVIYDVLCRAGAPYLLLSSQDLENWSGFYTTNGYNGLIRLTIPIQVGNRFFRILETNSVPIAMPEGNLLENFTQSSSMKTTLLAVSAESMKLTREEIRAKIKRRYGTFWFMTHPEWPPIPINIHNLPTTNINGRVYLLDIGVRYE